MAPAPKTRNRFIPCLRKTFSCGSFFPMLMMRNSGRQLRWLLAIGKTAVGYESSPPDGYSVAGQESDGRRRSALNVESPVSTAAFLLAAQNISHYTISLGNVGDSLDARAASNRLYKEGL